MNFKSLLIVLMLTCSTWAVGTSRWTQTTEAEFKAGTLENVVASNLGDLKLSRSIKLLLDGDPRISSVSALAEAPDGTIYAGTGPNGVVLSMKDQKVTSIMELGEATHVFSLLVEPDGALLIGTGGKEGRILQVDKPGDKPHELFAAEKVQYIWAMVRTADGNVYAATGPDGQLYEIKADGSKRVLFESGESNILCMIGDGKDLLYVGTDPHGLVYRINRNTGESFVLYNAVEAEIAALALDKHGNLYAATAEAREEGAPIRMPPAETKIGRPESGPAGVPLPSNPPKEPPLPPPPDNDPGRPNPIPRTPSGPGEQGAASALLQSKWFAWRQMPVGSAPPTASENTEAIDRQITVSNLQTVHENGIEMVRSADPIKCDSTALASGIDAADPPAAPRRRPRPNPAPGPSPDPDKPMPSPGPGKPAVVVTMPTKPTRPQAIDTGEAGEARPEGNAVYKIDPDGFVTEVFRQDVLILAMAEVDGALILATGNDTEGQIYQIRPDADETLVLATVDARQILSLLPANDGKVYMGMANAGGVASMTSGYAVKGTYTSAVLDATQISRFGKMQLNGTLPPGSSLTVAARSGNVKEVQDKGWSKWSDDMPAAEFLAIPSPSARFLQYRLTFTSEEGKATPVVEEVDVAYQMPNLPPRVKSVTIAASATGSDADSAGSTGAKHADSSRRQTITWEASDPNGDALSYTLYFRRVGQEPWIVLKEKLTEATFEWDTKTVADGRYQVRVTASDAAANPPGQGKAASRISDPILVDNTPPTIGQLKWKQVGGKLQIDLKVVDRTSTVASVEYSVDSNKEWQLVLPVDGIYDSPEEEVSISIGDLPVGQHQVTVRAADARGNQSFENVTITIASVTASGAK